ncbi:MAG: hypothetical protein IAB19_00005 [Proteobacteria bacterium]|uniref:Uncharacterized protein n=1 Tax=Candidatus Avisuccinivibrio stercorigallinarum TaxID=2840704 RepID=A0A9D9D9C5_9GAMM|nr:hypothetical protein [Candidatus Avisuccinivibrio stercorigallinarum]
MSSTLTFVCAYVLCLMLLLMVLSLFDSGFKPQPVTLKAFRLYLKAL